MTGVTEPLEFMFMFCAIPLYIVYAVIQGLAFASAGLVNLRLHSFGSIELATRIPMSLRAGLGMVEGLRRLSPTAKVGHIGLYRDEKTLLPVTYYYKMPVDITKGPVIIVDPALATGGSVDASIDYLKKEGCTNIKVMCIFASDVGVKLLYEKHPDVKIYAAQYIPTGLNKDGYIVTAAGDAGDRICGTCSYKPARPAKP